MATRLTESVSALKATTAHIVTTPAHHPLCHTKSHVLLVVLKGRTCPLDRRDAWIVALHPATCRTTPVCSALYTAYPAAKGCAQSVSRVELWLFRICSDEWHLQSNCGFREWFVPGAGNGHAVDGFDVDTLMSGAKGLLVRTVVMRKCIREFRCIIYKQVLTYGAHRHQ